MKKSLVFIFLLSINSFSQNTQDEIMSLRVHNDARKDVGVNPLIWSAKLKKQALSYAVYLAKVNKFKHSNTKNGENMTMSYESITSNGHKTYIYPEYPLNDAAIGWYNEIKNYRYSKVRRFRLSKKKIGHYTQMVWRNTREVGIASAISKDGKVYVVARYYPSGNYIREYPY
tara:strand:- start:158 stop:673 length:516 start_codon:yes stop_codon:yes gene_type:complete